MSKYFRYIESCCYKEFVTQIGKNLLASELDVSIDKILLWNVYIDVDSELRQKQKYSWRPSKNPCMCYHIFE